MNGDSFALRLAQQNLSPLWEQLARLVPVQPQVAARPAHWHYSQVRPLLARAAVEISAAAAERRVLVLENPGLALSARATDSLYAGLQIILPGEVAPSHRHSQAALRLIVEGGGAYTEVDGERAYMERGDFVITPGWAWHHHANPGTAPVVWVDGLDVPIVAALTAAFSERARLPSAAGPPGSAAAAAPGSLAPPAIINHRYSDARAALHSRAGNQAPDPCRGHVFPYRSPDLSCWALPTMAAELALLPRGFTTAGLRATAGRVFVVLEGRGASQIGDQEFSWQENDLLVAPSWTSVQHRAHTECVLFEFSDRAAQERLALYREERSS